MSYRENTISARIRTGVVPVGVRNGVNNAFSLPPGEAYCSGTLKVYLNGQELQGVNIVQIGPAFTSFQIVGDNLPNSVDSFFISYLLQS